MAGEDNGAEVTLEMDASEAFQKLAEHVVRLDRAVKGLRRLAEAVSATQDLIQREQLAGRALVKQLLEKYQRQDDRIEALVKLVDSHQATFESLIPPTGRPQ
jgi:hypothetical protein